MGIFNKFFKKKDAIRKREGNPDVYDLPNENERMNWGMEKARLTLHYFEKCLANPKMGQDTFSIKARLEENGKVEHIWLLDPTFDNQGNLFGIVGNEPIDITNVVFDQKIGITREYISDWLIVENGRLIGGYTIRAIRDGLSGNALQDFDKNLGGMLVDDGEDYFEPNFDTPEGAVLVLEDAYDLDDIEKAIDCKNFYREAEMMLKKSVEIELDDNLITKVAETLRLSFLKSLQENGMPKFKGVIRAFKRQFITDQHCILTEICYYPDGSKSEQKLNTYKENDEWKVLSPEN